MKLEIIILLKKEFSILRAGDLTDFADCRTSLMIFDLCDLKFAQNRQILHRLRVIDVLSFKLFFNIKTNGLPHHLLRVSMICSTKESF